MNENKIFPVILCGGTGTRLWPLSRATFPKQYLDINPNDPISFFQATIKRIKENKIFEDPIIICNEEHRFIVAEQLRQINVKASDILLEPIGRNTAPAVTIACLKIIQKYDDPIILVLPSDHIIQDLVKFKKVINKARKYAVKGQIVTFGITPNKPETGFGYIESKEELNVEQLNGSKILRFIEKPEKNIAMEFLSNKRFTWNSGIFLFKAKVMLREIELNSKEMSNFCKQALYTNDHDLDFQRLDKDSFSKCKNISIDKEIMEKTELGTVIPLNAGWSDVGSWESLWEVEKKDNDGNVVAGDVFIQNVKNSYLRSEDRLIVGIGIKDLVIVETPDAILVSNKYKTQEVKNVVKKLEVNLKSEANIHKTIYRPWGSYTSISEGKNWQVKRIIVKSQESLSLQLHNFRTEHWIVVSGVALVEINGERKILKTL